MPPWNAPLVLIYRVNRTDDITSLEGPWDTFAAANGAPELSTEQVLGKPIWDFVYGLETRHLYQTLMARARTLRKPVQMSFRCDAPDVRRLFSLRLQSINGRDVEFRSSLVNESPRHPPIEFMPLHNDAPRALILTMCSVCKKMRFGEDWVELEAGIEQNRLLHERSTYGISHALCPPCAHSLAFIGGKD